MALEITPNEVLFESVHEASNFELQVKNKSRTSITYRFRLQSEAISVKNSRGTIEGGHDQQVTIRYDPDKNESKTILFSMQIKYSEESSPGNEQTLLIPVRFQAENELEDDLFKSPTMQVPKKTSERWWKK